MSQPTRPDIGYKRLSGCLCGVHDRSRRKNEEMPSRTWTLLSHRLIFSFQQKVEEDRFMRAQEQEFIEKKRAAMAEKMHAEEVVIFTEKIAPAMVEAQSVLKKAGGVPVSDDALEALAKWKLDM
jgi:hypothetical protein